jgi:hypothetical protein
MQRDEHPAATRSKVETTKGSGVAVDVQVAEDGCRDNSPDVFIACYVVAPVDALPEVSGRNAGRGRHFIGIAGAGLRPETFEAF